MIDQHPLPVRGSQTEFVREWHVGRDERGAGSWVLTGDKDGRFRVYGGTPNPEAHYVSGDFLHLPPPAVD